MGEYKELSRRDQIIQRLIKEGKGELISQKEMEEINNELYQKMKVHEEEENIRETQVMLERGNFVIG